MTADGSPERIAELYADGWSRIVATMIRFTGGNWDLAEECVQEAFAQALRTWPVTGEPDQPLAWLTTTARRRAIDRLRRASVETEKLRRVAAMEPDTDPPPYPTDGDIPDERLELMFTCCHPALAPEARIALTLRSVAGMSTADIAAAFLVSEKTMGQRLFRAKQKVAHAAIPFRVPPAHLLPDRLPAVLHVVYLLFNRGYDEPAAARLADEAIRLGRVLAELMPDEPEALGLLALMLLHDARRASRVDADGGLVTIVDQDRSRWDRALIDTGAALCERALRMGRAGPFQLQAAIAACHATAPSAEATDWPQIVALYDRLLDVAPGAVVALNRAVALAEVAGPAVALAEVDGLVDGVTELDRYLPFHATRADLLRRLGRHDDAAASYRRALELTPTAPERHFLERRLQVTECARHTP